MGGESTHAGCPGTWARLQSLGVTHLPPGGPLSSAVKKKQAKRTPWEWWGVAQAGSAALRTEDTFWLQGLRKVTAPSLSVLIHEMGEY